MSLEQEDTTVMMMMIVRMVGSNDHISPGISERLIALLQSG